MLTRTLATESIDLIKGLPTEEKQAKLEKYTQKLMKDNGDIEFVEYKNSETQPYFTIGNKRENTDKNSFLINVPMYFEDKIAGSIDVGFTGNSMTAILKTTKNSIITIFMVMWFLSLVAVLINTLLITRQISFPP